jgi:hypothetical protein
MILRTLASLSLVLALTAAPIVAQSEAEEVPLVGRVEGKRYVSPTGAYSVEIPVLFELGGFITDTDTVVTFRDGLSVHASIACFPMDATQRWEHETRGRKEYLIAFFTNFVQFDFQQQFPGAEVQSAKFLPSVQDGALLAFNLLPGGTMFADRVILAAGDEPPVAKRGNLLFVKNEHVFILSIELAERVLERTTWDKKPAEEDDILRKRLMDLLGKMSFPTPPAGPAKS